MSKVQRYGIFQKLPSKQPTWVETATSLKDAKNRLQELTQMFPADYFIFDCENSMFMIPHHGRAPERREGFVLS
jgi:hypothetical protein